MVFLNKTPRIRQATTADVYLFAQPYRVSRLNVVHSNLLTTFQCVPNIATIPVSQGSMRTRNVIIVQAVYFRYAWLKKTTVYNFLMALYYIYSLQE